MLTEKKYYSYLHQNFIERNRELFKECKDGKLFSMQKLEVPFIELQKLIESINQKYGFNMQRMCKTNYNQFVLWRNQFEEGNCSCTQIKIALESIIFGCFADKILDSPRFSKEEKEAVCSKLNVENFFSSKKYKSQYFKELDLLLNDIRSFLCSIKKKEYADVLREKFKRALVSEVYMYRNALLPFEGRGNVDLLIDKSVEFESVAFMIASFDYFPEKENQIQNIANVFWLIDDLCDFIDDIRCKRKNSVLFYFVGEEKMSLENRIECAFQNIDRYLELLEINIRELSLGVEKNIYLYTLCQIWEWCSNVGEFGK